MLRRDYSWSENALGFGATLTLSVLAVTSLGLRYVTNPISCWTPAEVTGAIASYMHYKCFQAEQIVADHTSFENPTDHQEGDGESQFTFHQWVPFALGVAAILCLFPHVIWRMLSGLLWLDAHALVQTVADNQRQNAAGRHVILRDTAILLQSGLKGGNWMLTALTAGRKLLVFVVCVVQLIMAAVIFRPHLSVKDSWESSEESDPKEIDYNASLPLPENFFCEVNVKLLMNIQQFTIQCTMPMAEVYNKGFAFLFYLFLLLTVCCLLDTLAWACRLLLPGLRDVSLKRHLAAVTPDPQHTAAILPRFLDSLGADGRLLLAVTADCCGPLAAADLTNHLWLCYKGLPRPTPDLGPAPGATNCGPVATNSGAVLFGSAPAPVGPTPMPENFAPMPENSAPMPENFAPMHEISVPMHENSAPMHESSAPMPASSAHSENNLVAPPLFEASAVGQDYDGIPLLTMSQPSDGQSEQGDTEPPC